MNEEEVTAVEDKDDEGVTEQESDEVIQFQEEINIVKDELTTLKEVLESKANTGALQVAKEEIESLKKTIQESLETEANKSAELQQKTEGALYDLTTGFEGLDKTVRKIVNVVKPKDEAAKTINPAAVPPVVLQESYEKIATDVFQQMVKEYGRNAAVSRVEAIMEYVRKSSAGMEFLRISGDQRITAGGVANAIQRKLVSPHQIQITFTEFLRNLLIETPGYQPPSLVSLTETGSQNYAVTEVSKLVEQSEIFAASLSAIQKSLAETNEKIEALSSRIEKLESDVRK